MLCLRGRSVLRHGLLFVALRGVFPGLRHAAQTAEHVGELGNGHRLNLVGGVAFANGDGVVLGGSVIDGHGERNAELVGASVAFTNGDGGGVELGADSASGERLVDSRGCCVQYRR